MQTCQCIFSYTSLVKYSFTNREKKDNSRAMHLRMNTQVHNNVLNYMSNIKNVEAFGKLMGICTGYGGAYKPGQQNLRVNAMATLLTQARQTIDAVHAAKSDFDNATNAREEKFKELQRLCPRIINALKSSGAPALTVEDAQASVRKMNGKKLATAPPVATGQADVSKVRTRTARGLDYGSLADHFAKLVETVSSEPGYQPNEPELTVDGLTGMQAGLRNLNAAVNQASVSLSTSRKNRSAVLYKSPGNLVATAKAAKQYIRAVYGTRSVQGKEVSRIRFTQPEK